MHRETDFPFRQTGVTLIEMIVAIVVMGILVAITSMFVRNQVITYTDVAARADLADEADTAVRRLTRDLQAALPNSVRVSGNFMEFVPIRDAGRYRAQKGVPADNELDFTSSTDNSFEVFGPPVTVANGDQLVINNLGIPGATIYDLSSSCDLVAPFGTLNTLTYPPGCWQGRYPSSQGRFQVVSRPVTYAFEAATRTLWRYSGYAIQSGQVTTIAGLDALAGVTKAALATDVDVANSAFSFAAAALQRNAIVSIRLVLTRNGESVTLFEQVNIFNSP